MSETYTLHILSDNRHIELDREHYTVGRSDSCDIVIKEPTLSRVHAELSFSGETWYVLDCHSTNGVFVNGARLSPEVAAAVKPGDSISFGTEVAVRLIAEEADDERTVSAYGVRPQPTPQPARQYVPQPILEPAPQYVPKPTPQPDPQPTPQPARQYVPQPTPQPARTAATTGASSVVRAKIEAAQKKGAFCKYAMIGFLVLGIILSIAVHPGLGMLVLMPIIIIFLNYNEKYGGICSIMKDTPQAQLDRMLSGSWDSAPRYPGSKIYCGDYAIFCERNSLLLPLENMVWVYLTNTKTKTVGITAYETMSANLYYRDRKQYIVSPVDSEEIKALLRDKIVPLNPNVMVGFTEENRRAYAQMTGQH